MIADKVKKKNVGIYAIARPHGLRGYILLESPDREHAEEAVYNLDEIKSLQTTMAAATNLSNIKMVETFPGSFNYAFSACYS
jgi:hypothetical protein